MSIHTDIGTATADDIFVRGRDLSRDLIPNADFVDMLSLCILGHQPEPRFKRMLNVLMVTATDHGFTPSSISARLTGCLPRRAIAPPGTNVQGFSIMWYRCTTCQGGISAADEAPVRTGQVVPERPWITQ